MHLIIVSYIFCVAFACHVAPSSLGPTAYLAFVLYVCAGLPFIPIITLYSICLLEQFNSL